MKRLLFIALMLVLGTTLFAQSTQKNPDDPYVMEFYYKAQWGHQQEFLQLFFKNHYPLLMKMVEKGRILSVKVETPAAHMTEDARWDYRVTVAYKNSAVGTTSTPDQDKWIKELWPDQATYLKEEQRRFEIVLAHWDLAVAPITPPKAAAK